MSVMTLGHKFPLILFNIIPPFAPSSGVALPLDLDLEKNVTGAGLNFIIIVKYVFLLLRQGTFGFQRWQCPLL